MPFMRRPVVKRGWGSRSCVNPDCPAQLEGSSLRSKEAMDIEVWGEAVLTTFDSGGLIKGIADIYRLKAEEISASPAWAKSPRRTY